MAIKLVIRKNNVRSATPLTETWWTPGSFYSIGSGANASLRLNGAGVAPEQAVIMEEYGRPLLMSTAEGTVFNGESLGNQAKREITQGAQLRLGAYVVSFVFEADGPPVPADEYFPPVTSDGGRGLPTSAPAQGPTLAPTQSTSDATRTGVKAYLTNVHDEDYIHKYYFYIQGGARDGEHILLNSATVVLGWDGGGQNISSEAPAAGRRAVVQFNVSTLEVSVTPQSPGMVAVNNVLIESPRTLSEGDELRLAPTPITEPGNMAVLIFHEPPLVDLFSAHNEKKVEALAAASPDVSQALAPSPAPAPPRRGFFSAEKKYLGHFSTLNIIMFVFVILLTAVMTFFLLDKS